MRRWGRAIVGLAGLFGFTVTAIFGIVPAVALLWLLAFLCLLLLIWDVPAVARWREAVYLEGHYRESFLSSASLVTQAKKLGEDIAFKADWGTYDPHHPDSFELQVKKHQGSIQWFDEHRVEISRTHRELMRRGYKTGPIDYYLDEKAIIGKQCPTMDEMKRVGSSIVSSADYEGVPKWMAFFERLRI